MRAGITKSITFHCGRHTFAVMQLEHGTEFELLKQIKHLIDPNNIMNPGKLYGDPENNTSFLEQKTDILEEEED